MKAADDGAETGMLNDAENAEKRMALSVLIRPHP